METKLPRNFTHHSGTVLKAFKVLEIIAQQERPASLNELIEIIGMDKSTTFRLIKSLIEAGYVKQDESKKYFLSFKIISLARNLLTDNYHYKNCMEIMEKIAFESHETVHLNVLDDDQSLVAGKIKGSELVAVNFEIGDRAPLHCTSIGKVFLAYQDNAFIDKIIQNGLTQMTSHTITDESELRREILKIRERGYATDNEELSLGLRCIAVPVFSNRGFARMGISISGPTSRFTNEKLDELRLILIKHVKIIG
jgi:IclR family KDG regulon transcriptional repressor